MALSIFKDKKRTLSEAFDDEYFLHMQWAHFASGGAGGGMRWPNRNPHSLTAGMRKAQLALSRFLPLINWQQFNRINLNKDVIVSDNGLSAFCCGSPEQAVLWLLRTNNINKTGMLNRDIEISSVAAQVPGLKPGRYLITPWNTESGTAQEVFELAHTEENYLDIPVPPIAANLAFAVKYINNLV